MIVDHSEISLEGCAMACNATVWLGTLGIGIVFSTLFAKTRRINLVMHSAKNFRRIRITVRQTLVPVLILLAGKSVITCRICLEFRHALTNFFLPPCSESLGIVSDGCTVTDWLRHCRPCV